MADKDQGAGGSSDTGHGKTGGKSIPVGANSPDENTPNNFLSGSPTAQLSISDFVDASTSLQNMYLAHEIAFNSSFALPTEPPGDIGGSGNSMESLVNRVTSTMKDAFWDILREQINSDPPNYGRVLSLIREIKEETLEMVPVRREAKRTEIEEVLDMTLIEQKMKRGALDIKAYTDFVLTVLGECCAPVRDEKIDEARQLTDVVLILRNILEIIDLMKTDLTNFRIRQVRPLIRDNVLDYEKKTFSRFLEKQKQIGLDGLSATKEWLNRAHKGLLKARDSLPTSSTTVASNTPDVKSTSRSQTTAVKAVDIVNAGFVELLDWDPENNYPETVNCDMERFFKMDFQIRRICLQCSILVICQQYLTPTQFSNQLRDQIKSQINILLSDVHDRDLPKKIVNISDMMEKLIDEENVKSTRPKMNEAAVKSLRQQMHRLTTPDDPVKSLLMKRLLSFFNDLLRTGMEHNLDIPKGLCAAHVEIAALSANLIKLVTRNRSVYGDHYDQITKSIINPSASTSGSSGTAATANKNTSNISNISSSTDDKSKEEGEATGGSVSGRDDLRAAAKTDDG